MDNMDTDNPFAYLIEQAVSSSKYETSQSEISGFVMESSSKSQGMILSKKQSNQFQQIDLMNEVDRIFIPDPEEGKIVDN